MSYVEQTLKFPMDKGKYHGKGNVSHALIHSHQIIYVLKVNIWFTINLLCIIYPINDDIFHQTMKHDVLKISCFGRLDREKAKIHLTLGK